jgi:hypothetical protein
MGSLGPFDADPIGRECVRGSFPGAARGFEPGRADVEEPQAFSVVLSRAPGTEDRRAHPRHRDREAAMHVAVEDGRAGQIRADPEELFRVLETVRERVGPTVGEARRVVRDHEHEPIPDSRITKDTFESQELRGRNPAARAPWLRVRSSRADRDDRDGLADQPHERPRAVHAVLGQIRREEIAERGLEPAERVSHVDVVVAGYRHEALRRRGQRLDGGAGGLELRNRAEHRVVARADHEVDLVLASEAIERGQFLARPSEVTTAAKHEVGAAHQPLAEPVAPRDGRQRDVDVDVADVEDAERTQGQRERHRAPA